MAKKQKKQKGWLIPQKQVNDWLGQATHQILQGDYPGVIQTCQRILRYAPAKATERAEALEHLATAYTMLKRFEDAYQILSQALEITPQYTHLWYNRGLTGRYTMRMVQAVRDFEKAVIDMSDCLPQPQGNLELTMLMQKKYDEAEVALKRALEIDPNYDLARRNLAMLPLTRQTGETPQFALRDPAAQAKVNLTLKLVDD
jgi:tetratricopeptide (TPR) repeat protein